MAKTKALISFAVTAKLICVFVFAYAKSQFSHNEAHIYLLYACIAFVTLTYIRVLVGMNIKSLMLSILSILNLYFL